LAERLSGCPFWVAAAELCAQCGWLFLREWLAVCSAGLLYLALGARRDVHFAFVVWSMSALSVRSACERLDELLVTGL